MTIEVPERPPLASLGTWRPRRHDVPGATRLLVVLSDIEMGAGGIHDDFPHDDLIGDLLLAYNGPEFADIAVDVVFNGDTFDFLRTTWKDAWPIHISAEVATGKFGRIADAHPHLFKALAEFVSFEGAPRKTWFIVGNHDPEIVFPQVREAIRARVGVHPDRIAFPGLALEVGDVHVEHGNQNDRMFRVDPKKPFLDHNGELILNLPWGAVALLDVMMPLQPTLYALDRWKPRHRVLDLVPEARDLIVNLYWKYWTRDYLREYWSGVDPMKRLTWTMFREIVYRFGTSDLDVPFGQEYTKKLKDDDRHRLIVVGHTHEAGWQTFADRKLLRTGCFRDEFSFDADGNTKALLPKVYAEVYLRGGQLLTSHLVEMQGPPPAPGFVPDSVFDVLSKLGPLLGAERERKEIAAAVHRQEALEAKEAAKS